MSELTITAANFTIQPLVNLSNGDAEIRWWYLRSFLDSNDVQVQWGTGKTGFWVTTPCTVASGLLVVDQDTLLWTTDDAQDPNPGSLSIAAAVYRGNKLIQQLQIAGKAQWVVPSSLAPSTTWADFSAYNQAVFLANPALNFYTAPQVDALIDRAFDEHPASDTELGTVLLTVPADIPATPVVWGANDPLVRDAIAIQGVDVSSTAPLDSQALVYNQANDQWEPSNQAAGTGNVVSNEVSSVDGQVALASGTGGKTIKFSSIVDDGTEFNATGMRVIAAEYDSDSANRADNGTIRLNESDFIAWRNEADSGNINLSKDNSDRIASSGGFAGALTGNVTGNLTGTADLATNVVDGDKGDITITGGAWAIDTNAVTYTKMQQVSTVSTLLGRGDTGAPGDVQEITLGGGLSMTGTVLAASGAGGYDTVEDEGTPLAQRSTMNFVGAGVTAADSGGVTVVTIPGGGGGAVSFADIARFGAVGR